VTNILVNAAWRGIKVLFASKNNKAVDVVEGRVNGLANRPTLMRLGSREYQADLAEFLSSMLAGTVTPDDKMNYDEALECHKKLSLRRQKLEEQQERTLRIRNAVDRIESEADLSVTCSATRISDHSDGTAVQVAESALNDFSLKVDALDSSKQTFIGRILLALTAQE